MKEYLRLGTQYWRHCSNPSYKILPSPCFSSSSHSFLFYLFYSFASRFHSSPFLHYFFTYLLPFCLIFSSSRFCSPPVTIWSMFYPPNNIFPLLLFFSHSTFALPFLYLCFPFLLFVSVLFFSFSFLF